MNVKLYYSFYVFCESNGVSDAAERLGISQPAITAQLQQLEEEASYDLFQQQGRRKVLTRYGQDLHLALKARFENLSEAVTGVEKKHASASEARVRIAGRKELLSRILTKLSDVEMRMDFYVMSGARAAGLLQKGLIDVAVVTRPPDSPDIIAKTLFSDPRCLAWPSSWRLPEASFQTQLKVLASKPFLAYGEKDDLVEVLTKDYELPAFKIHRMLADWGPLVQLASRGHGWTVAPVSQVKDVTGLTMMSIPGKIVTPVNLYLAMNKADRSIPWLKDLFEQIRESI